MKITMENIEAWLLDMQEGRLTADQEKDVRSFLQQHPELGLNENQGDAPVLYPEQPQENNWNQLKKSGWDRLEKEKEDFLIGKLEKTLSPEEEEELNERLLNDTALAQAWEIYRQLKLQANENETAGIKTFLSALPLSITAKNYREFFIVAAETREAALMQQAETFCNQNVYAKKEWDVCQQLTLMPMLHERMPFKEQLKKREGKPVFLYTYRWYAGAAAAVVALFFGWKWINAPQENSEIAARPHVIKKHQPVQENTSPFYADEESLQPNNQHKSGQQNGQDLIEPENENDEQNRNKQQRNEELHELLNNNNDSNRSNTAQEKESEKQKSDSTKQNNFPSITQEAFYKDSIPTHKQPVAFNEENINFTTMKGVVSRVSNGFIEVDRKQDTQTKEFFLKIGKMKFHRKKTIQAE